jgi:hypothetical protein
MEGNMHDEPRALFKKAIIESLPNLQPLVGKFLEYYQVWRKVSDSQWSGAFEARPDINKMLGEVDEYIGKASAAFSDSFPVHHPEYAGTVGFRGFTLNWADGHAHIVRSALGSLWVRYKTFELTDDQLDTIVQEFADFVDSKVIRLRYQTQLINFKMPADSLVLPDGLMIRRLTDEEVSAFHGGPIGTLGFLRPRTLGPQEFVLEGELDEPKILGNNHLEGDVMAPGAKVAFDKAITSLRTFKEGCVGYDFIHFQPVTFCPIGFFSRGEGDKFVPSGSYVLTEAEYEPLMAHAKLIFRSSEASMEMACSRLADAENRTRPQDQIVDAVIGMEALLLAGIEDRKSELSFRFSLNYAMLFPSDQRHYAYRVARDLYGLRSVIAHGSSLDENRLKIAGEKVVLHEAGRRAKAALRGIIMHFLPKKRARYKDHEFWQRAYFGLPEPP